MLKSRKSIEPSKRDFSHTELSYVEALKNKILSQPPYAFTRAKDRLLYGLEDLTRSMLKQHTSSKEVINTKEIRVIGLRRSGNHAIINWMQKQQAGTIEHLNNIPLNGNPFRWKYIMLRDFAPDRFEREKNRIRQQAKGNFIKKDCLIYSYEDHPITKITSPRVEHKHDFHFGKSLNRYDVLILRDPFNLIASRLENNMLPVKSFTQSVIDLWLEYAKEFLGETQYLPNRKVLINYNHWVADINYRREIAFKLDLPFTDAGINDVRPQGGGSSFDKRNFAGRATEMDVLGRWKHFTNNPLFLELLNHTELLNYSDRIFGHVPEMEGFVQHTDYSRTFEKI
jgi:hypothetical protein